ncbi:hypothetical protein OsJ_12586 [Oryza sativa Japonica Group]|uniref:Uncharacterized protein n=1 Tax=Oryza sativa subsp. japonica TaxID=39947 RepID=A3AMR0_ORYSJ|nr:hypothetical protein OsJ_12586 [Oryza sativa Japonica Group]
MRKATAAASRYASYDSPSPSPSPRRAGAAATPGYGSRALVPARSGRDLRAPAAQQGNLGKGFSEPKKKALTEVKNGGNTRTFAMVLRSERELLTQSKEQEDEIAGLRLQLEQKDTEVKADKHTPRSCFDDEYCSSPRTPVLNEETAFSLECSIGEDDTPNYGSPDEMFSKDLNPCLTPCISKSKSEEYEQPINSHRSGTKAGQDSLSCGSRSRPMSKSSDHHKPTSGTNSKRRVYRSDQDKFHQNLF